jgi:hypothetical protein
MNISVFVVDVDCNELYNVRVYNITSNDEAKQLILEHISYCYQKFGVNIKLISSVSYKENDADIFIDGSESESELLRF